MVLVASNQHAKNFMQPARASLILLASLPCLLGVIAGCQDGPIPENRVLNPWARKQWEEDEKFGPTYYKRMDELAAIRAKASGLADSERDRLAQEIVDVYGQEPSPAMRSELIRTLAYLPTSTAQTGLASALADDDPDVRTAACQGLARVKGEESLRLLAKTADDTDENLDVRIAAVRGLGNYKDEAAMQALGIALEDKDPAIQKVAIESLRHNTGDYGHSVPAWKEFLAGGNPAKPPGPSLAERVGWPWF
jgi:hypothetical protein